MVLNRRKFFKWLGVGVAASAVAPSVIAECGDPWCGSIAGEGIVPHDELHSYKPEIVSHNEYADYVNFSNFKLARAIDEVVAKSAKEMGYRHGLLLNELVSHE